MDHALTPGLGRALGSATAALAAARARPALRAQLVRGQGRARPLASGHRRSRAPRAAPRSAALAAHPGAERTHGERGDEALKNDWLALEEALHAHWMAIAIEHYNLGVEAGRQAAQHERIEEEAASVRDPLERARALVAAIAEALDEV